ncbi:MAG: GHMP kinase [Verrucomicrobiota bacterium]|nr:GHMP kinase [Verrucomicrobiota bacterium]
MIIRTKAYPRAGLAGNPSDGYFGKTIAFCFGNFHAQVVLYESQELKIIPDARDRSEFAGMDALAQDVKLFGYYGGIRLLKATIKVFGEYCRNHGIRLHDRNFTIRYYSNIPRQVGLAGSSAIITACLRALLRFYEAVIPKPLQANLVLAVERDELQIPAGLQDRVAEVYQGLVYMDFSKDIMDKQGYGLYEELNPALLPPLYIAYRADLSEGSEVYHGDLRALFLRGDPDVLAAVKFWGGLTDRVKAALLAQAGNTIGPLLDANFDQRAKVSAISPGNLKMVSMARSIGASAKFTGSGGAIVGTCDGEAMFARLREALEPMKIKVFKPVIVPASGTNGENHDT